MYHTGESHQYMHVDFMLRTCIYLVPFFGGGGAWERLCGWVSMYLQILINIHTCDVHQGFIQRGGDVHWDSSPEI